MTEQRFTIQAVRISRGYSENSPFEAAVSVKSNWDSEINIKLPEDRVLAIIDLVADLIVDTLEGQFSNMRKEAIAAIEAKRVAELPAPIEA